MKTRFLIVSIALGLALSVGLVVVFCAPAGALSAHAVAQPSAGLVVDVAPSPLSARQAISTAYVVVRFGAHDAIVRPITFTEPISAYHALELSGLAFTTADMGYGPYLCSIAEVGDSSPACDNGTQFWSTAEWNAAAMRWDARMVGVADALIANDGHVEGFSWSDPDWLPVDPPPAPALTAAWQALAWLKTQQQANGGFGSPGNTTEVLMALGANRMRGGDWQQSNGASAASAILNQGATLAATTAGSGKLALALSSQDACWPYSALRPADYYSVTTGAFSLDAAPHALAMLGTAALSETLPASATAYLLSLQQPNGGWEWGVGWGVDTNSTALALQALIAAGEAPTATAVISGLAYLKQAQNVDGGFPYDPASSTGTGSDVNSTAYVVQALLATGEDPLSGAWATDPTTGTLVIGGANPIAFLLEMQLPDGSFEWQAGLGFSQMATQQAATALLYRPFPVKTAQLATCRAVFLPFVTRD
ncbi:MAG: hypothetical protein JXA21_14780 [Anaerolineae bacterium]|nr:hypothetical protein [Anaerolineae bacterium]